MSLKTGTKLRIFAALLLMVAARALSGYMGPSSPKNAVGCSIKDSTGEATANGCGSGGDGCWECGHSDGGGGTYTCWENADGTIGGCLPDGSGGPYAD
jgi:hypothetical protein